MSNYLKALRELIGHRKVIHPGARVIIENAKGEILFVRRTDSGQWGLPAGGLEEEEDITACIRREVLEETGLKLLEIELIGISSHPSQESVEYPNGDRVQYFTAEFYCAQWHGEPRPDDTETREVRFMNVDAVQDLPAQEFATFESLLFFRATGRVRVR
ncbi:MAG: NUDIX domain-containing protein [Saprospiraceae bacterium]|nr:NUDIX domain-containing protein [Lewinella sp.]